MPSPVVDVLIVDDDADFRAMLAFALGLDGFDTRQAADADEALVRLSERAPDCMVLDLVMPMFDGFDLLARMRADGVAPDAKVVVLSGRDDEPALVRAWELKVDEFLLKPTDPDVIVAKVRNLAG